MCSDKSSHLTSICVTEESAVNTAEVEIIECNVNIIRCDVTYLHHKTHIFTDLHSYNAFFPNGILGISTNAICLYIYIF